VKLLAVFLIFVHFGLLCFGGGNVLTPIYIEELINGRHWMTLDEFGNLLSIAQITPGPISVNAATFFGYRQAGIPGAIAATTGLLMPSFILMTLALRSLKKWSDSNVVKGLMWGVGPATMGLMATAAVIFVEMSVFTGPVPWQTFFDAVSFNHPVWPEGLRIRPLALVICLASAVALCKTKIQITTLIFISAAIGAALFPLLGN
jgi:chromate transporter